MKITILLVIAVFAVLATGVPAPRKSAFINKEIVDAIRKSGATWEAYDPEENPLRKYSDDELRHFLGVPGMDPAATLAGIKNAQLHMPKAGGRTLNINEPSKATINVAASFDWRTSADGTRCKPNVLTQGSCGGCYSFTTA